MLRKLNLIWLACLTGFCAMAQPKTATLSGTLVNYNNPATMYDITEYERLLPRSQNVVIRTDSAGNFKTVFKLAKPGFFILGRTRMYISPGDNLVLKSDGKLGVGEAIFTGKGASANNYMQGTQWSNMGAYIYAGRNIKATPEETYNYIIKAAANREAELKQLTGVSAEFKRLQAACIKADVLVSFNSLPIYVRMKKTIANKDSFIVAFTQLAQKVKTAYINQLVDPSLLSLPTYRDVVPMIIKNAPATANIAPLKEFEHAYAIGAKMSVEHDKVKMAGFQKNIDSLDNAHYKAALKISLQELLKFGVGDVAADFAGIDMDGHTVKLSDLRGKIIFVDLWATWCGPCLKEMPSLELLKQKYKDDPRIVFISLSIDDASAIEAWKKNVRSRGAEGYQWHTNVGQLNAYHVESIPRILLIDKDFKMANMDAPWPSQPAVNKAIDDLLQ